jgi:hypothetical protein
MKKLSKLFRTTLLLLVGMVLVGTAQLFAQSVALDFGDALISGRPGDEVTVTVRYNVLDASSVTNFDFNVSFDSNFIQIAGDGVKPGAGLVADNFLSNVGAGTIQLGYIQNTNIPSEGVLFTLTGTLQNNVGVTNTGIVFNSYTVGNSLTTSPVAPVNKTITIGNTVIRFPNTSITTGTNRVVYITAEDLGLLDAIAYDITFSYNPAALQIVGLSDAGTLSEGSVQANINSTTGTVTLGAGFTQPLSQDGNLVGFEVRLLDNVQSATLQFTDVKFYSNANGSLLGVVGVNGVLTTNAAPVFTTTLANTTINVGETLSFTYVATDSENDALVYSLVTGPAGASINSVTGALTYTATAADVGTQTITVGVSDGVVTAPVTTTATVTVNAQARVQIIHNSADPAASSVDIYVNGAIFVPALGFRQATAFVDVPAEVALNIEIYPAGADASSSTAAYQVSLTLTHAETYTIVASGLLGSGFAANPNEVSTAFFLDVIEGTLESHAEATEAAFIIYHGSTDAPGVDVYARDVAQLVAGLEYTDISDSYLAVPAGMYTIDINPAGASAAIASFAADLSAAGGQAIGILASGFLSPADNNNGAAFGLLAVFADGTTAMLEAAALPFVSTDWQRARLSSDLPDWFAGDTERGMAYGNGSVYVVSRNAGANVRVLNAADGTDTGMLDVTGVAGGLFPLNAVDVSDDGFIFAANMTLNASTAPFKFYHWSANDAAPVAVTTTVTDAVRLGDKFTVTGNVANGTAQVWAASATGAVARVYIWTMNGGTFNAEPVVITLSDNVTGGAAAVEPLIDGSFWMSFNGSGVKKYAADGTLVGSIPTTVIATGSNSISHVGYNDSGDELIAVFTYGVGNENAKVVRIPGGIFEDAEVLGMTPALRVVANGNGAGDVSVRVNDDLSYTLFVLSTNNGVGAYSTIAGSIVPPVLNTNRAPVFTTVLTDRAINAAQELSFTYVATDADGDNLTYSIVSAPEGVVIGASSGTLTWTPTADQVGVHTITVGVTDGFILTLVTTRATVTVDPQLFSVTFEVYMELAEGFNPATQMVYIAGDLPGVTSWEQPGSNAALALTRSDANQPYRLTVQLPAGNVAYKFFANAAGVSSWDNGEWPGDPNRSAAVAADTTIKHLFGVKPGETIDIEDARTLPVGAPVWVRGISTTPDFGPNNRAEFFMQDLTGGIKVTWFGFGGNAAGVFNAGQDVEIHGTIRAFGNQIEIGPWAHIIHASGNDLPEAAVISSLGQWAVDSPLQGMRVRVDDMILPDSQSWPTDAFTSSGISRNITGITGSVFQDQNVIVRLARFNNFWNGSPRPQGAFNMVGVLGRFNADPQLFPFFEGDITRATSIDDVVSNIPVEYALYNNFPNPFNPTTNIRFSLPESGFVSVEVFNVMGQRVATLVNSDMAAGTHTVTFNAANLASGTYMVRMQSGNFTSIQKMMLVK